MPVGIHIHLDMEEPRRILNQMIEFAGNPIHANRETGGYLVSRQIAHFDTGVDEQGSAWKPLSKWSRDRRREAGQSMKPLIATGTLRQSFSFNVTRDQSEVGTPMPYAPAHHFGTDALHGLHAILLATAQAEAVGDRIVSHTKWNVPARPFLYANEAEQRVIIIIYQDHLLKAMGADRPLGGQY